jgi:hypothetical protein
MMLLVAIDVYFDSLLARVSTTVVVPHMPMAYAENDFNNCHANVARWVAEHPEYAVVSGWSPIVHMKDLLPVADDGIYLFGIPKSAINNMRAY